MLGWTHVPGNFLIFIPNHRITSDNYLNKCRGDKSNRTQFFFKSKFYGLKRKNIFSVFSILILRKKLSSYLSYYWYGIVL